MTTAAALIDPPPEVREAAADMGYSVHEYKELYLDRPSFCESLNCVYKHCVRTARPSADISHCEEYLDMRVESNCKKWEEKY